jgi:hypothetical protein
MIPKISAVSLECQAIQQHLLAARLEYLVPGQAGILLNRVRLVVRETPHSFRDVIDCVTTKLMGGETVGKVIDYLDSLTEKQRP